MVKWQCLYIKNLHFVPESYLSLPLWALDPSAFCRWFSSQWRSCLCTQWKPPSYKPHPSAEDLFWTTQMLLLMILKAWNMQIIISFTFRIHSSQDMLTVVPVSALRWIVPVYLLRTDVMDPHFRSSLGARAKQGYRASLLEHYGEHVVFILLQLILIRMYDISFVWQWDCQRFRAVLNSEECIHTSWRGGLNWTLEKH